MTADLTVVVVNWNTVDLLDDCLRSIVDYSPAGLDTEIIVVDNASSDGSVAHLATRWPAVRVIANDENVGFCRANNQAIRVSEAPFLLLVNTDARLTPGSADAMLAHLQDDQRAAVVGPRLVYGDGSFQRWTAGQSFSLRSCGSFFLGLDRLSARHPALAGMYLAHDTDQPFKPGWVSSAVMLLRRQALDEIGLLDESIFVYMDDVDLCQRATDAGWNVWYAADTTAVHFMGASTVRNTGQASPEALRALNRWYERRHGRRSARAMRALETVGFGARAGICALKGLMQPDEALRNRRRTHWTRVKLSLEPTRA
jgi:N-acetylglucosaminyl-diphospho-decaprenol L-rhamnosyltransferase